MDPSSEKLLKKQSKGHRSLDDGGSDFDTATPIPVFLQKQRKGWARTCLAWSIVVAGLWALLSAGGSFLYKKYDAIPPMGQSPPWYPAPLGGTLKSWSASYDKAAKLVSKMTLPEKVNITTGTGWKMGLAVGTTGPALNVGFPQLQLQDGPLGIRFADNATAWPAGITTGATFDKELFYLRGKGHATEAQQKGIHVVLGPCVGPLGRMPAGGRNWEGFGSDPYLQGIAAAETIKGIQDQGVQATIKHFVANEQEHFRQPYEWGLPHSISSNIDDRTLHELYAWPFYDSIKVGVASVMCSYNQVNNSYACDNSKLINGILKDEMGFQGYVMSDWLAQRSGVASALAGLDMTMPGDGLVWEDGKSLFGAELSRAVLNGSVPVDRLNDMVTRVVAAWYQLGQDDEKKYPQELPNFSSWTNDKTGVLAPGSPTPQEEFEVNKFLRVMEPHTSLARQVAAEGTVLLKNVGVLPVSRDGLVSVEKKKLHDGKLKIGIFGEDAGPGKGPNYCKDRGCNQGTLAEGWGSGSAEFPWLVPPVDGLKNGFDEDKVEITEHLDNKLDYYKKNPEILTHQDICFVFGNSDGGEGFLAWGSVGGDRNDLFLQKGAAELIEHVANNCGGGNGQTVVGIHSVGPVDVESFIDLPGVKAVLYANLPGMESGNAYADVVFGDVNPSGHLPYTLAKSLKDFGDGGQVLYLPNAVVPQQDFTEGLYVDYRHFDKFGIEPRYEFGYGLSYTTFGFSGIKANTLREKSRLPAPRPGATAEPPTYDTAIPDKKEALWPDDLRRLERYNYPYLDSVDDIRDDISYPYPDGYDIVQPPSPGGGDEGGNPNLWDTYVTVTVDVANTGPVAGKVVPQLYLSYPPKAEDPDGNPIDFPVRVLRGFEKFNLERGEKKSVSFDLTRRDLSYWDVVEQNWVMVTEGEYTLSVGSSSRDLPLSVKW